MLRALLLSTIILFATVGCQAPSAQPRDAVVSHLPLVVAAATTLGRVAPQTRMDLRIVMPLRNREQLDDFLESVGDPESPAFQNYLTPEQFHERFHPTDDQVAALRTSLQAQGLVLDEQTPGPMIKAQASVSDIETMFHTEIHRFKAADGFEFLAPASDLKFTAGLPIAGISGLHTTPPGRFFGHVERTIDLSNKAGATNYLAPADIRAQYNIPTTLLGDGQSLAAFELDSYDPADITAYEKSFNLASPPLHNIYIDGYNGQIQNSGGQFEVTVDIELLAAMAPHATGITVYEAQNGSNSYVAQLDMFGRAANPVAGETLPRIISYSWGLSEHYLSQADATNEQTFIKQMAAQGQTLFVAAGDVGATLNGGTPSESNPLSVIDPAAQPYLIAVGGTALYANNNVYDHETTWNEDATKAGGGGVSIFWPIPSYQVGVVSADSGGSSTMRNIPDVCLNAASYSGYRAISGGQTYTSYGTSFATPTWAGYYALVQQARAQRGLGPMGFAAPYLYSLGKSSAYKTVFNDIADGSNNGFYHAVTGFDDATGWGSFKGTAMVSAFSSGVVRRTFVAPTRLKPAP